MRWHQSYERFCAVPQRLRHFVSGYPEDDSSMHYKFERDFSAATYYSLDCFSHRLWEFYWPDIDKDGRNVQEPDLEEDRRAFMALVETVH
jgi:hypothetical protein